MRIFVLKSLAAAAITVGAIVAAAAPAQAAVTTFASFTALGTPSNIRWSNSSSNGNGGTGGSLYSVTSNTSTTVATRNVSFSFLNDPTLSSVTNVTAGFTLNATAPSGSIATLNAGVLTQPGIAGTFSFLSTAPITIGTTTYGVGSNLLSGTFSSGSIVGTRAGTSGSLGSSTITFTSDFISFVPGADGDLALLLASITSPIQATPTTQTPTHALRSFRSTGSGQFSSDLTPPTTAVPEPAVWGLMIVGFGMVGVQARRRSRVAVSA